MPQVIRDDGRVKTILTDDGRQVQVPSDAAAAQSIPVAPSPGGMEVQLGPSATPTQPVPEEPADPGAQMAPIEIQAEQPPTRQEDLAGVRGKPQEIVTKVRSGEANQFQALGAFMNRLIDEKQLDALVNEGHVDRERAAAAKERITRRDVGAVSDPRTRDMTSGPPQDKQVVFRQAPAQQPGQPPAVPQVPEIDTKAYEQAVDREKRTYQKTAEAVQAQAEAMDTAYDEARELRLKQAAKEEQAQSRMQEHMDQQFSTLNELQERVRGMSVDPDRIWARKGTNSQIGAAIAVGLGALGSAFTGGPNQAMQIIQAAIDRDIQAQMSNIQQARADVRDQQSLLGLTRQYFADETQMRHAANALAWDAVVQRLDGLQAQYGASVEQGKYQALRDQAEVQKQTNLMQWKQTVQAQAFDAAGEVAGADPERLVPGVGVALDKEAAKTVRKAKVSTDKVRRMIDQLSQFGRSVNPAERAKAAQIATQLKLELKNVYQLGVLSESDEKLLDRIAVNPTKVFQTGVEARLANLREGVESEWQSIQDTYLSERTPQVTEQSVAEQFQGAQ